MCKFCENTSVFIVDPSYFDDLEDNPNQLRTKHDIDLCRRYNKSYVLVIYKRK